jgi:hypothetical protein
MWRDKQNETIFSHNEQLFIQNEGVGMGTPSLALLS